MPMPASEPLVAALLALLLACRTSPPAAAPAVQAPAPDHEAPLYQALRLPAEQPETTALVVAIHGLGDAPESFQAIARGWPEVAHVLVPAGPIAWHQGWSWFPVRAHEDGPELASAVGQAADRLATWLGQQQADPLIVTGFSQGGMLSFTLATRHPDLVDYALPVGGMLPTGLRPSELPPSPPPILALHGAADEVVPTAAAVASVEALAALGWPVELTTFDGVGHSISAEMHRGLDRGVRSAARGQSPLSD